MRESYSEVLARHAGPESYADHGNMMGVATTGVHAGPVLSSVNHFIPCADAVLVAEGKTDRASDGKHDTDTAESKTWSMHGKLQAREPGDPIGLLEEVASSGQKTPLEAMLA